MLSTNVVAVHRRFGTVLEQELDRVGRGRDGFFHHRVHAREHVVGYADARRRAPNADAHPDEVVSQPPMRERRPLCPPAPPPTLTRTVPASRSRSSWTTIRSSGL